MSEYDADAARLAASRVQSIGTTALWAFGLLGCLGVVATTLALALEAITLQAWLASFVSAFLMIGTGYLINTGFEAQAQLLMALTQIELNTRRPL